MTILFILKLIYITVTIKSSSVQYDQSIQCTMLREEGGFLIFTIEARYKISYSIVCAETVCCVAVLLYLLIIKKTTLNIIFFSSLFFFFPRPPFVPTSHKNNYYFISY